MSKVLEKPQTETVIPLTFHSVPFLEKQLREAEETLRGEEEARRKREWEAQARKARTPYGLD